MMGWDVAGGGGVVGERQSGQQVDDVAFPARPSPSSCPQSARGAALPSCASHVAKQRRPKI